MNDFYNNSIIVETGGEGVNKYVAKVFGWMFLGLMLTALTTLGIVVGISTSQAFFNFIQALSGMILIVFLAQVLLVGYVSVRVQKMNPAAAIILYLLYAVINGFTVGLFAFLYAGNAVVTAFGITAVSFGVMAVYGLKTNADLTRAGNLLRMGLIGVIILSVINIFLRSGPMEYMICILGLFVFLGLTAYDTKKIKTHYAQAALSGSPALASNLAIVGALMLYLDFINMFLFILRLMSGGRK